MNGVHNSASVSDAQEVAVICLMPMLIQMHLCASQLQLQRKVGLSASFD